MKSSQHFCIVALEQILMSLVVAIACWVQPICHGCGEQHIPFLLAVLFSKENHSSMAILIDRARRNLGTELKTPVLRQLLLMGAPCPSPVGEWSL